jgi:heme/copper-type cytochrome/quinol oxidase subunit 3
VSSATIAQARRRTEPTATAAPRSASNAWWGMVTLVATEATLFAVFIASYFYLRWHTPGSWPPDGLKDPKLLVPAVMTVILVSSSFPVYWAERGIRHGRQLQLRVGLAITILLGATFLALQSWEYTEIARKEYTPRTDAYGSIFFTITGAHGAHVAVGLLLLLWALVMAWRGHYDIHRHQGVQLAALYWHFVDVAWLVIFLSLYVTPRL